VTSSVPRWVLVLVFAFAPSGAVRAQGGILSGTVTGPSGVGVPNARVSVKRSVSALTTETQTDSVGAYKVTNLEPGDYQLSVTAEGYSASTMTVTMVAGVNQTMDVTLGAQLSLGDLGFSVAQTQGSAAEQARLDRRSHMLKVHQRLGLITTIPLVATVITGTFAGGRSTTSTTRDVHAALGTITAGLYFTSAYYAIAAPKIAGTRVHGPIRLHKILAWIHGPGMILTPVLGAMAFSQRSRGERPHGIASAHAAVAVVTAAAYGASILSVSLKF
jgi:Carboxypeptidase regulatory-like domain